MNENDLPGEFMHIGSSMTDEGVAVLLAALNAQRGNPDEVWQALQTIEPPDVTEFSRYSVTLRMDSEYTAYTELINGKSPDTNPPDTLTATWQDSSVDIPVAFWSLADGSGLGFWLDTNGKRSWHVIRSRSWQAKVVDKTQLTLPWTLAGEVEQDDEGRVIKADLRGKITDPPTVPVDIHLTGDHESGITLFNRDTLQRISKRNKLLRFTAAPTEIHGTEYTDFNEDISAHQTLEAASKQIATPVDERGAYVYVGRSQLLVSIHKVDYPNQSSLPLDEIGLHSDPKAFRIFLATVLKLINSDLDMGRFPLDDLCKLLSQKEWERANAEERHRIRTATLRTLIVGSWTSVGNSNDLASILNIQFIHRNDDGEVESLTIAVPPWMKQSMVQRQNQPKRLESEYSKTHRSEGTLKAIGYLPTGTVGFNSYAIGIAEWMALHEAVSRGSERTFIRQDLLNEMNMRPTLKQSLSKKTHKVRIVEYYCKALHSLLNVPKGADLAQILDYGDAEIVREHREPHMTLKAWTDYESITGVNRVEQWLKQKGVLRPASAERSAIADDLRKRVEIRAKLGKQAAARAKRAAEKKANGKR